MGSTPPLHKQGLGTVRDESGIPSGMAGSGDKVRGPQPNPLGKVRRSDPGRLLQGSPRGVVHLADSIPYHRWEWDKFPQDKLSVGLIEDRDGILNRRLTAKIQFHNIFHGFRTGKGTGTASLEANLLQ